MESEECPVDACGLRVCGVFLGSGGGSLTGVVGRVEAGGSVYAPEIPLFAEVMELDGEVIVIFSFYTNISIHAGCSRGIWEVQEGDWLMFSGGWRYRVSPVVIPRLLSQIEKHLKNLRVGELRVTPSLEVECSSNCNREVRSALEFLGLGRNLVLGETSLGTVFLTLTGVDWVLGEALKKSIGRLIGGRLIDARTLRLIHNTFGAVLPSSVASISRDNIGYLPAFTHAVVSGGLVLLCMGNKCFPSSLEPGDLIPDGIRAVASQYSREAEESISHVFGALKKTVRLILKGELGLAVYFHPEGLKLSFSKAVTVDVSGAGKISVSARPMLAPVGEVRVEPLRTLFAEAQSLQRQLEEQKK